MIKRLLIANRGEIACRIIATAQRMGIFTIAVYSAADVNARHVRLADTAVCIGPAPARESYLVIENILNAARQTAADAIHPGYGFLSENADFTDAVAAADLTFVGPPASAMRAMGDKANAKRLMKAAGVPLLPGYEGENQSPDVLLRQAEATGFPLLIKPSAGGGGKGMKIVHEAKDFAEALLSAQREARTAFDNPRVILERYLEAPRHVEVQIFSDNHGNTVHLFERDCTPQRRYQKVIEEAPAPDLPPDVRDQLHLTAVAAAKAVGYSGAGTVEFLLDSKAQPYFMEMNTRLQVEHPVTECITGIDLVEWQLRVAQGEHLPLDQAQIKAHGHAVEARLYAEDATQNFLPQTGTLHHLSFPNLPETRIDTGVESGDTIGIHYDPMIAKLITHAATRDAALDRLGKLLDHTKVMGLVTNRDFLRALVHDPDYRDHRIDTGWLDRVLPQLVMDKRPAWPEGAIMAARLWLGTRTTAGMGWDAATFWRTNLPVLTSLTVKDEEGQQHNLIVDPQSALPEIDFVHHGRHVMLYNNGNAYSFEIVDRLANSGLKEETQNHLRAPMPGRIIGISAVLNQLLPKGAPLITLEAMKMEHVLKAPADGYVRALHYTVGDQVEEGADLLEWEVAPK